MTVPFKSQAQRRKFAAMVASGEMTQAEFDRWQSETPKHIPERVAPKKRKKDKPVKRSKRGRKF